MNMELNRKFDTEKESEFIRAFLIERMKYLKLNTIDTLIGKYQGYLSKFIKREILTMNPSIIKKLVEILIKFGYNKPYKKEISVDHIKNVVCNYFNTTPENIDKPIRKRETVQVRQIAMYFSKSLTNVPLKL
jgi:chromosomal replication initiation ATPase DnaA